LHGSPRLPGRMGTEGEGDLGTGIEMESGSDEEDTAANVDEIAVHAHVDASSTATARTQAV